MADTGAPWNIPYVEDTDLVRDWPTDSLALANSIADGLDAAGGLVAVHYAELAGTFSTTSTSYVNIGLSKTFTPADASNRLLVMWNVYFSGTDTTTDIRVQHIAPHRDGSNLITPTSPGSRTPSSVSWMGNGLTSKLQVMLSTSGVLDIPSTAATSTTIDVRTRQAVSGAALINRSLTDGNDAVYPRAVSTLTVMEYQT